MEQQGADLAAVELETCETERESVPKWHVLAQRPAAPAIAVQPPQPARLDLARKVMLGLAGVLTLLWLAVLAWGALRLIEALIF